MTPESELEDAVVAIREEYERRGRAPQIAGQYSFLNPAHARLVFERERAILGALRRQLELPIEQAEILDVGASSGVSLAFLAAYEADPERLHGVDIDEARIAEGRRRFPAFDFRTTSGHGLDFPDDMFDVVQQITMLSSVHSDELRRRIAAEMVRVARPGGLIISFDVCQVPLAARLLSRATSFRKRRARPTTHGGDEVRLTPVHVLPVAELRELFAGLEHLEARPCCTYRPLVERFGGSELLSGILSRPSFAAALVYVGRKPR